MLRDGFKYSEKEMAMAAHFGVADIAGKFSAFNLYGLMAEKAFIANDQSKWADSLRRCMEAMAFNTKHRMTPEWDAMIEGE